jgi:nucleotide-binding universal stress UspA family protein
MEVDTACERPGLAVLPATDGSEHARKAAHFLVEVLAPGQADVTLLTVITPDPASGTTDRELDLVREGPACPAWTTTSSSWPEPGFADGPIKCLHCSLAAIDAGNNGPHERYHLPSLHV